MMNRLLLLIVLVTTVNLSWQQQAEGEILCPFFKAANPDTSSWSAFIEDLSDAGCDAAFCAPLAIGATIFQKPLRAALGEIVDLTRLDEIPFVSHDDLYNNYPDEVTLRINQAADSSGMIMLQDLVDIKLWVAEQAGVDTPSIFSKGETVILFLRSGGDLASETVLAADVLTMLSGTFPNDFSTVGIGNYIRGSWKADFSTDKNSE